MNGRFSAYSSYETTGIEWLRDLPRGWQLHEGKRLFSNRREPSLIEDEQLAASQQYGVVPQALMMSMNDAKVMLALKGTSTFRHVEAGDFVISLRSFEGGIEYSAYSGCVSPAYTVLAARKQISREYYRHLLKSGPFVGALQSTTDSLRDGKAITFGQFGAIPLPIPSLEEQSQIARFLDYETAKIDALIEKQQQLIALLKEKRQAVISHAVTKGLNPDAPLRDSGVEWLGEVPAHWTVGKCGFYLSILSGFAFHSMGFSVHENDVRLLRGINVAVSKIRWDETVRWRRFAGDGLKPYEMAENDLVLGMDRPLIGEGVRVAKIRRDDLPCLLLQRVARLKTGDRLVSDYLMHILSSDMFEAHFSPETTGVSVPHISPSQIADFVIPIPPIEEQKMIIAHLDTQTRNLDALAMRASEAERLLQERRTALISAAVTGKIDVRNWQSPDDE